jgi:hypothetical protein
MLSRRLPQLRTYVHTLVIPRVRYTLYHSISVKKDETCQAKFAAEGYYPDGPCTVQIGKILRWLNHSTCRQSWQNLLVPQKLLANVETVACQSPPQLTLTGVGEHYWEYLGVSNVRRLRFLDYMTPFSEAHLMRTRFPSLTHLGMVVYMDPSITRGIINVLLRSRTLERLAVVIVPQPSATTRAAARAMGNAIHWELLQVDDERLVILEQETSLLRMLRQPDGDPFWQRVDEVAHDVKKNGKIGPSDILDYGMY